MAEPTGSGTRPDSSGGGNSGGASSWTGKVAGVPMWGWVAGAVVVGAVALLWMQNRKKPEEKTSGPEANFYVPGNDNMDPRYDALYAMLRDIQGQLSTKDPATGDPDPQPGETGLLPAPTGLRELAPGNWDRSVHLGWNAVSGNKGYKIREVNGKAPTVEVAEGAWQHIYDQNLQPGTAYTFVMSTKNSAGKYGAESGPFTTAKTKSG